MSPALPSDPRTGLHPHALRRAFADHLHFSRARESTAATAFDRYVSLALSVRDRLVDRWAKTQRTYYERDVKRGYYLSAEFLLGRALVANLQALGIDDAYRAVLRDLGVDLDELIELEPEPGLGNGGLGRLAACFLESMATQGLPVSGYGIRYEFGIFEQVIRDGQQVERADEWLRVGNPWEIERPEYAVPVSFGGHTERVPDRRGGFRVVWRPAEQVLGVPFDTPIAGYGSNTVNTLRLWSARAGEEFDFFLFGLTADEVLARRRERLEGRVAYASDPDIREVIDLLASGFFSPEDRSMFRPIVDSLLGPDEYMVLADFTAYAACQREVEATYADQPAWLRKAALNIAQVGEFSSDRTVREYARDIWGLTPVDVELDGVMSMA